MSDLTSGFAALTDASDAYEEAGAYHDGTVSEVFGSATIQRVLSRQGRPFRVNVIKSVIDARADRLEMMSATVPGNPGATERLAEILTANGIEFESGTVHSSACKFGDYYSMVWPELDAQDRETGGVVISHHSPLGMRIVYDPDNPRRKMYAVHAWEEGKGPERHWRVNLLYPDRIERWAQTRGGKTDEEAGWEPAPATDDPDSWTAPNPYGVVPVFHFRNGTPYGVPVHYGGYGAQDAVTKLVVSHMSTIDFHIAPQRYALIDKDALDDDDDLDLDDDPEFDDAAAAERETGGPHGAGLKSGPGVMQWFRNAKSVGQFDPAKSETFTGPLRMYLGLMAQTTKTPLDMLDQSGDEPSGESRRRKDAPLRDSVKTLAKMYAATWQEVFSFALKVARVGDDLTVKVAFAPYEVVSDREGWETIKSKIENGVPVRVALLEAGYSEEQVEEWFPEDEENRLRVADLVAVSDVLQKLGSAVALGIISAEEARALLPEGVLPEGAASLDSSSTLPVS